MNVSAGHLGVRLEFIEGLKAEKRIMRHCDGMALTLMALTECLVVSCATVNLRMLEQNNHVADTNKTIKYSRAQWNLYPTFLTLSTRFEIMPT